MDHDRLLRKLLLLQVRTRLLQRLLMPPNIVLFICVENACRSLMAEAMFNERAPPGWRTISAGTRPAPSAHPRTSAMLAEVGLEIPGHAPQLLVPEMVSQAARSITLGCQDDESCPAFLSSSPVEVWGLPDPARLDDSGFRRVRDDLSRTVDGLVGEIQSGPSCVARRTGITSS